MNQKFLAHMLAYYIQKKLKALIGSKRVCDVLTTNKKPLKNVFQVIYVFFTCNQLARNLELLKTICDALLRV